MKRQLLSLPIHSRSFLSTKMEQFHQEDWQQGLLEQDLRVTFHLIYHLLLKNESLAFGYNYNVDICSQRPLPPPSTWVFAKHETKAQKRACIEQHLRGKIFSWSRMALSLQLFAPVFKRFSLRLTRSEFMKVCREKESDLLRAPGLIHSDS